MSDTPTSNSTALPGAIRQRSLAPPDPLVGPTTENGSFRCHPLHGAPDRFARRKSSPPQPPGSSTRSDLDSIREEAQLRGVRRLCHFTGSANLASILSSGRGIRSTDYLRKKGLALPVTTDRWRLDGHLDHVCLSVQVPNAWCFEKIRKARGGDWVVLFIAPLYLWRPGTKFCPVNAATAFGRLLEEGPEAFRAMFQPTMSLGRGEYTRRANYPAFLPTDEQAEVVVPNGISPHHIVGIAVHDEAQGAREHRELLDHGIAPPPIVVVPEFYDPRGLSRLLKVDRAPEEMPWWPQN